MTDNLIAPVERLSARLGVALTPGSADYVRASEALWSASTRARSIAQQSDWTADTVPDSVVDIVLSAAMRIYRNPDRFITNQAGSFAAGISPSDFATGDIFLTGERTELAKHKPTEITVLNTYRDDPANRTGRRDPANYVAAPVDGVRGDDLYGWSLPVEPKP